jgi:hypothetical protein
MSFVPDELHITQERGRWQSGCNGDVDQHLIVTSIVRPDSSAGGARFGATLTMEKISSGGSMDHAGLISYRV